VAPVVERVSGFYSEALFCLVRCQLDEIDTFRSTKKTTISGRVNISTVHLELLRTIHDCKWIAAIVSINYSSYKMTIPNKKGGNG